MTLISAFLFLLLISSGSIFASSFFNKKYEEVLPITCSSIVAIGFIFGIIGILKYSTAVICSIGLILFVLGLIRAIKKASIKELLANTFTPSFFIFLGCLIIIFVGVYRKLFDTCDEFSHWGDIVKVMTLIDAFGTNPNSHSIFKSYPPAMSLFQYTLQEINCFISKDVFSEWLCYFSYDILEVVFVLPVCSRIKKKNRVTAFTAMMVIICVPYVFYKSSFFSVYIDSFLSFLIASGSLALLYDDGDGLYDVALICSIAFMLTLSKDSGLLFAALLVIASIIKRAINSEKKFSKTNLIIYFVYLFSVALPKLLWNLNMKLNNVEAVFGEKVDFINLIEVLIGKDQSYRKKVLKNFVAEIVTNGINIGNTNITVNYFALLIIGIVLVCLITEMIKKQRLKNSESCVISMATLISSCVIFIIGTCVSYMYKFTEIEALALASFGRYMNTVYLALWLYIFLVLCVESEIEDRSHLVCGILICVMAISTDFEALVTFVSNSYAKASIALRENYMEAVNNTLKFTNGDNKIWFIDQDQSGENGLIYQFCVRPNYIDGEICITSNGDNSDTCHKYGAEEWKKVLVAEDFDYVFLYCLDEDFYRDYKTVFNKSSKIKENTLYKVENDGTLTICE